MQRVKVGVFDSGVGGLLVASAIKKALPNLDVVYKEDRAHVPYGTRGIEEIHGFVKPIFQKFVEEDCRVIVVACNTVTTNLIEKLRTEFSIPMVGMEPAVKPAAQKSKSRVITVCATPRTLGSKRYKWLKKTYAKNIEVLEPNCSDWAEMIETQSVDRDKIAKIITNSLQKKSDQIVLGCTHYHWIEQLIKQLASNKADVIQPEKPVIAQLKRVLARVG